MDNSKLISVIIPVYNIKGFLRRCIHSVINQSYTNLEIILVDDGSTDGSEKICDSFSRKDLRIRVIHKKNGGLSSARNAAINVSNGAYLFFLDGDDFIDRNCLQNLYENECMQLLLLYETKSKKIWDTIYKNNFDERRGNKYYWKRQRVYCKCMGKIVQKRIIL